MNKSLIVAMAIVAAMSATTVMAEDVTPTTTPAPAAATAAKEDGKDKRPPMKFEDIKAKALKGLEERAAKIQQHQACVQAASDKEALKACFPNHGKGKGGWHKRGEKEAGKGEAGVAGAPAAEAAPAAK